MINQQNREEWEDDFLNKFCVEKYTQSGSSDLFVNSNAKRIMDFIESTRQSAAQEAREEVLGEFKKAFFVSPHVSQDGSKWDLKRCSDCFCTIQKEHTHDYVAEKLLQQLTTK